MASHPLNSPAARRLEPNLDPPADDYCAPCPTCGGDSYNGTEAADPEGKSWVADDCDECRDKAAKAEDDVDNGTEHPEAWLDTTEWDANGYPKRQVVLCVGDGWECSAFVKLDLKAARALRDKISASLRAFDADDAGPPQTAANSAQPDSGPNRASASNLEARAASLADPPDPDSIIGIGLELGRLLREASQ